MTVVAQIVLMTAGLGLIATGHTSEALTCFVGNLVISCCKKD